MGTLLRRFRDGTVIALLRSPLHRILSGSLLVIGFTGRRTGTRHERPVSYAGGDGDLLVFAGHAERKVWWRNLEDGAPVRVLLRGAEYDGHGEVVKSDSALAARYLARFPRARKMVAATPEPVFVRVTSLTPAVRRRRARAPR